jgi:hypothetical protein
VRGTWLRKTGRYGHAAAWLVAVVAFGHVATSWAYWSGNGSGSAAARTGTLTAPGKPAATGTSTVTVSWSASASFGNTIVDYHVQRRPQAGSTWTDACNSSPSAPLTTTSCTDSPEGEVQAVYRVTAILGSWTAASPESDPIPVNDFNPPAIAVSTANGVALNASARTNQNISAIGGTCGTATGDLTNITASIAGVYSASTTLACNAGLWNWTLSSTWTAAGSATVTVTQKDASNNTGTATRTITIDRTAPSISITTLNGAAQTWPASRNQTVTTIGGTCSSGTGDLAVSVGITGSRTASGSATCSSGLWSWTVSPALTDGTYTLSATQSDAAGNTGSSAVRSVTVDTVGPSVAITQVKGVTVTSFPYSISTNINSFGGTCGNSAGDTQVSVSHTGPNTSVIANSSSVNCSAGGTWTWNLGKGNDIKTPGTYTVTATQSDALGNVTTVSVQVIST